MKEAKAIVKEILMEMSKLMNASMEEFVKERGEHFRYPVYMSDAFMNTDIEEMELSVRAYNCLKRAGYGTIGDLVSKIEGKADLLKIKNMGKLSANEVMISLCCFQFSLLTEEKKRNYVNRIVELNVA